MGGSNTGITSPSIFGPAAGSAPSASLVLADHSGHALDPDATVRYFVNPLNLATDPVTGDIAWSALGTAGMIDRNSGLIELTAPAGAVNPSWNVAMRVIYLPGADRIISTLALSTANENGNSTGVPIGTLFQANVMPTNPDNAVEQQIVSQFTVTGPGAPVNGPVQLYPALEHFGPASQTVTLYEMTLNAYYTGDVPNYLVEQASP